MTRSRDPVRLVAVVLTWLGVLLLLTTSDRTPQGAVTRARSPVEPDPIEPTEPPSLGQRVSPLTLTVLAVLALCLWVNAAVDTYRFNVAIAVVGTIPLAVAAARARAISAG